MSENDFIPSSLYLGISHNNILFSSNFRGHDALVILKRNEAIRKRALCGFGALDLGRESYFNSLQKIIGVTTRMMGHQIIRMAYRSTPESVASAKRNLATLKTTQRVAVMVDADNTSPLHATTVLEEVAKLGDANIRRVYGNFSPSNPWIPHLQPLSMIPIQQFNYTSVRIRKSWE